MNLIMDLRKSPRQCLQKPTTICRRHKGRLCEQPSEGGNHAFGPDNVSISIRNRIRAQVFLLIPPIQQFPLREINTKRKSSSSVKTEE